MVVLPLASRRRGRFDARTAPRLAPISLLSLSVEIPQVRRSLTLLGGHQETIGAQHIVLVADSNMIVVFSAVDLAPVGPRIWLATVALRDRPRTRQCIIGHRDFTTENVGIGFVEVDAFLDDGLIVLVKRDPAAVERARTLEVPGLDFEHVVAAVPIQIGPFADRIT